MLICSWRLCNWRQGTYGQERAHFLCSHDLCSSDPSQCQQPHRLSGTNTHIRAGVQRSPGCLVQKGNIYLSSFPHVMNNNVLLVCWCQPSPNQKLSATLLTLAMLHLLRLRVRVPKRKRIFSKNKLTQIWWIFISRFKQHVIVVKRVQIFKSFWFLLIHQASLQNSFFLRETKNRSTIYKMIKNVIFHRNL